MLKSYEAIYEHGQIRRLETPPDVERARIIVTVLPPRTTGAETPPPKRRRPPKTLEDGTRITGDIVSSPYPDEEWEAMFERTTRQLQGDPEAFKRAIPAC